MCCGVTVEELEEFYYLTKSYKITLPRKRITSFFPQAQVTMDTKSLVAIVCIVIAMVILLSLTFYTLLISWRQISREYEQRQGSSMEAPRSYENTECIENEHAVSADNVTDKTAGETSSEHAQATSDRCQTTDSNVHSEVVCTKSSQSAAKTVLVQVETNHDTSF